MRLTEDAVDDLRRLHKKDPQILRDVFAKMLLLERSTGAGEPLVGALIGFRKIVVGDRDWRIVWRETVDEAHDPVLEIAEVWAAGARADSEIYAEMTLRLEKLENSGHPQARPLAEVIEQLGRLYEDIDAHSEPELAPGIPEWLARGLAENLHLTEDEIESLTLEQAQKLLTEHWAQPRRED